MTVITNGAAQEPLFRLTCPRIKSKTATLFHCAYEPVKKLPCGFKEEDWKIWSNTESQLRSYFSFEKELWAETRNAELYLNEFKSPDNYQVLKHGSGMRPDNHRAINPSVFYDGKKFTMWYNGYASGPKKLISKTIALSGILCARHTAMTG